MIGSNIRSMWHFPEMWTLIDATSVIAMVCSMLLSFAETPVDPLVNYFAHRKDLKVSSRSSWRFKLVFTP